MANQSPLGTPPSAAQGTDPTRVALIASDSLYRDAVERYLLEQVWLELVGVATEEEGHRLLSRSDPDLVILRDEAALHSLADAAPGACFVLMESPEAIAHAEELLRQGVVSFISPDWSQTGLDLAFTAIRAGHVVLPSSLTALGSIAGNAAGGSSPSRESDLSSLTDREVEVLALLSDGLTNKQIGKELEIARSTVKSHVHRILGKLGVRSRGQAAALHREWIRKR